MPDISFVAGGGANQIGGSHYVLKINNLNLGIDFGPYFNGQWPEIVSSVSHLLLTHGHFDHVGLVPAARRIFPGVKTFSTIETKELAPILWEQTSRKYEREGLPPPFTREEAKEAYDSMIEIPTEKPLVIQGVSIIAIPAGHILGARSFVISADGETIFVTGDASYKDRSLIKGGLKISAQRIKLLVRESTYINTAPAETREEVINNFIKAVTRTLERGGRVLIAALSIDRAQDVYCVCKDAGINCFIDGSKRTFEVYRTFLPDGDRLSDARWFSSRMERLSFLDSREPGVVISSSGMVYKDTPSAWWAERLILDPNSSIFLVNYQDPGGQGFTLAKSKTGQYVMLNGNPIRRRCDIQQFDFSSHMDGPEGEELEANLNPDNIFYVHGENDEIDKYIERKKNDGRRRVKSEVNKEVKVC